MNSKSTLREHLVDYYPQIKRIVQRIAKNEGIVDDLTQECCARIIEKEKLWNGDKEKINQWINAVTRNLSFTILSRQKKTRPLEGDPPAILKEKDFSQEHIQWVLQQFSSLPESQKNILRLKYFQNLTLSEIGKELNVSQPAITYQHQKALKTLKRRAKSQGLLSYLLPLFGGKFFENWEKPVHITSGTLIMKIKFAITATTLIIVVAGSSYTLSNLDTSKINQIIGEPSENFRGSLSKKPIPQSATSIEVAEKPTFEEKILEENFIEKTLFSEMETIENLSQEIKHQANSFFNINSIFKNGGLDKEGYALEAGRILKDYKNIFEKIHNYYKRQSLTSAEISKITASLQAGFAALNSEQEKTLEEKVFAQLKSLESKGINSGYTLAGLDTELFLKLSLPQLDEKIQLIVSGHLKEIQKSFFDILEKENKDKMMEFMEIMQFAQEQMNTKEIKDIVKDRN